MGFIAPAPPPVELEEWKRLSHLERIKPLAQDWAINGFGTPSFVYLLYIVKLIVYAGGGLLVISATHEGTRRARQPEQLVDGTDRVREGGRVDDAVGGARPRRGIDAADAALLADDRRVSLLAAPGHDAPAAVAGASAADAGDAAHVDRRGAVRRAARRGRVPAGLRHQPGRRRRPPGVSTRSPWGCCWRSGSCSDSATRCRSWRPARRSTGI